MANNFERTRKQTTKQSLSAIKCQYDTYLKKKQKKTKKNKKTSHQCH